jgi:hypothetical protein
VFARSASFVSAATTACGQNEPVTVTAGHRRAMSWCCWAVGLAGGFAGARLLPGDGSAAGWLAAASVVTLTGVFTHPAVSLRVALLPFLGLLAAIGLGLGAGAALLILAAAVTAMVVVELVHRRWQFAADQRQRCGREGITTAGTVVAARRFYVGGQPVARVAIRYTDHHGREHVARIDTGASVEPGSVVRLRYLVDDPQTVDVLR